MRARAYVSQRRYARVRAYMSQRRYARVRVPRLGGFGALLLDLCLPTLSLLFGFAQFILLDHLGNLLLMRVHFQEGFNLWGESNGVSMSMTSDAVR